MIQHIQGFIGRHRILADMRVLATFALFLIVLIWAGLSSGSAINAIDLALQGGVNHKLPRVEAPASGLQFSTSPKDHEFLKAGVFPQPLIPVGHTTGEENKALAEAVRTYDLSAEAGNRDDVKSLRAFLNTHPDSAWRPALLLNIGLIYRETGHFSKAMPAYQQAWDATKDLKDVNGRNLGDAAIAELTQFQAYLGRKETLAPLLASVKTRNVRGTAEELLRSSERGMSDMINRPEISFRCGPLALTRILMFQNAKPQDKAMKVLANSFSTPKGLSLSMVQQMSVKAGMNYQMAFRTPGAPMIFPAVAHWNMGHYAAVVAGENGRYLVQDSTFDQDIGMSSATLDEEASGYFLVPAGKLPQGWRPVSPSEGDKIWGRGNTGASKQDGSTSSTTGTPSFDDNGKSCKPCATWNVEAMSVSLLLHDRPLRYTPPVGPAVNIDIDYSHRDVQQPQTFSYVNLGPKWTINWLSYVTDTISSNRQAVVYERGGGSETFSTSATNSTSTYAGPFSQSYLTRAVNSSGQSTSFQRFMKDGSSETFGVKLGTKFFLTEVIDPQGNKVRITYDAQYRIAGITDAIGQVTTFSYENSDPLKITKITDPFGRNTKFTYNSSGQLASVTDMIGITSSFAYGTGDFVNTLTTPYGTTTFAFGDSSSTRYLTAKDALNRTSRVEFNQSAWPITDPVGAPVGMDAFNYYLNYRNSFIWNPEQYKAATAAGGLDYTKAKIIHWLHTSDGSSTSRTPESIKEPGENRVWYRYPGQGSGNGYIYAGTTDTPIFIGRVMDGGATQLQKLEYNTYGKLTKYTDPLGRVTTYTYDSSGVDLLSVSNTTGGTSQTLLQATYNSQHLPTSVTGANGKTTAYEYNSSGQVTKITDALNNATTYTYNTNHYLTTVHGPATGADYVFTYDTAGRIATATDPAGSKVSYDYDDADRPTKVTFPDGTTSTFGYNLLDLISTKDRLGQTTNLTYDAERQLIKVADPLSQITQYTYTLAGKLATISDPNNHVTSVARDIQDRVTTKTYADGTKQTITYEAATSRIKSTKDALNQVTAYAYNNDDSLSSITYTNAPRVSFTYDTAYLRPLTMTDGTGTTGYTYYPVGGLGANLVKTVVTPIAGASPAGSDGVTYTYDALDRVVIRSVGGVDQTTTYDALGRVTNVNNALDTFTYSYADATSRVSKVSSTKGPQLDLSYYGPTGDELLKQMKYTAGGKTLSQFDYEFNANDNVTKFTESYLNQQFAGLNVSPTFGGGLGGGGGWVEKALALVDSSAGPSIMARQIYLGMVVIALALTSMGWLALFVRRKWRAAFLIPSMVGITMLSSCGGGGSGGGSSGGGGGTPALTPTAQIATLTYDKAQRLTSASVGTDLKAAASPQFAYEYDAASNLTGITAGGPKKTLAYTNTNAINGNTYDANGSPTLLDGSAYTWDGANRLVKWSSGTNSTEFAYDGLSRLVRVIEKVAGIATADHSYTWCGDTRCLERDNMRAGTPVTKQYFEQGEMRGTAAVYYVRDHLGSVRQLVDTAGAIQAQYEYDPYGNRVKISGSLDSDIGFASLFHLAGSGLDMAVYRAYDSAHARWLNRDPIEESGGLNLYNYVSNIPTTATDNSGLIIDTVADVGFVAYDIYQLVGNCGNTAENWVALGLDIAGVLVPFATGLGVGYRTAHAAGDVGKEIGILRDATKGKGNFGLGTATAEESQRLGHAWVGEGHTVASDGKTLVSQDKLRQYRPPSQKNSPYATTGTQSNFQQRYAPKGPWQGNGHLNISK